ncbi:hypothetical protein [Streptomyces sp. DSM 15324]|uniref:hypothetical protein n=1 Tax=Streptomyces sp. DSM 15324 TaxID=1739111 RepID=UPI00074A3BC6|nr:hypothetical protein [Streptomyces sp. DSM 15324]KUO08884.1 hypothetical protein AQJ58_26120 [Streptomyces sp. DSM 15324]
MGADMQQFLLTEDDLDESFFGEEPSVAYDPVFVSGDESGRVLIDLINMLTHGSHPEASDHASALYTSVVGSVVFHNVSRFAGTGAQRVFQEFVEALHKCDAYRMQLNDGMQFDVSKAAVEPLDGSTGDAVVTRWVTTSEEYRIEGSWAVAVEGDVLSFVNVRVPDASAIHRLARMALDRLAGRAASS